jgi:hypothetical protein
MRNLSNMSPPTDHGDVVPLWYSFDLVKKRVEERGGIHEVTQRELPSSKDFAGVKLRLTAGSYREIEIDGAHQDDQGWRGPYRRFAKFPCI